MSTAGTGAASTTTAADSGATSGAAGGGSAGGSDANELLKAKGCMNCHDRETKKVGPSFKEIAGKKGSTDALVAKLRDGKGHVKVAASDAEIKTMVQAVLATK
jgi:cytochrome c551/c552